MSSKVQMLAVRVRIGWCWFRNERYWSATSSDCRLKRKMLKLHETIAGRHQKHQGCQIQLE
jgi:hypothetical protein